MRKKDFYTLLGFALFITGFVAIILNLVGVELAFLLWLDTFGQLASFLVKIVMIIGGIIVTILGRTDWEREND